MHVSCVTTILTHSLCPPCSLCPDRKFDGPCSDAGHQRLPSEPTAAHHSHAGQATRPGVHRVCRLQVSFIRTHLIKLLCSLII